MIDMTIDEIKGARYKLLRLNSLVIVANFYDITAINSVPRGTQLVYGYKFRLAVA